MLIIRVPRGRRLTRPSRSQLTHMAHVFAAPVPEKMMSRAGELAALLPGSEDRTEERVCVIDFTARDDAVFWLGGDRSGIRTIPR